MKEHLEQIGNWTSAGKQFAIATVTHTWGSSPRPVGSTMLISSDEEISGSVSGGCVEGAVVEEALKIIQTGGIKELSFGVSDADAWDVGLTCGGQVTIWLERCPAFSESAGEKATWDTFIEALGNGEPCVHITKSMNEIPDHFLFFPHKQHSGVSVDSPIYRAALEAYNRRKNELLEQGEEKVFIKVYPPKSRLLIIGASHVAAHLIDLTGKYDMEAIVIDPRDLFAGKMQFNRKPDSIHADYPSAVLGNYPLDAYSYAVILSHDPKIDDNALHVLLRSQIAYIGALGSRRTHAKRSERLRAAGFKDEEIERIHAPVGVDIHAKTPAEIALSIMAQIVAEKNKYQ